MKGIVDTLIIIAVVSLIVGVIVKAAGFVPFLWCKLMPASFLNFSNTCLLIAIAWSVREIWPGRAPQEKTE